MLNTIGDFCINLPLGTVLSSESSFTSNYSDIYGLMDLINEQAKLCRMQSPGMKDSGVKIEFNYILQEMTTKYIEFIMYNKSSDENLNQAKANFLDKEGFEKVIIDAKMYLAFYFNTISYSVEKDFEIQNGKMTTTQTIYSVLFLVVNIEVALALIIIFVG